MLSAMDTEITNQTIDDELAAIAALRLKMRNQLDGHERAELDRQLEGMSALLDAVRTLLKPSVH